MTARIPLDLPHAGTIALRIGYHLARLCPRDREPSTAVVALLHAAEQLVQSLAPYRLRGENPHKEEAELVVDQVSAQGRELVARIEALGWKDDRLGQAVRNLYECLEKPDEGAELSLRAGENPDSPMRW